MTATNRPNKQTFKMVKFLSLSLKRRLSMPAGRIYEMYLEGYLLICIREHVQTSKTFQLQYPYHCPCLYDFVPKEKMEAAFCTHLHNGLFFHFRGRCVCVGLQQQPRHRSNPSVQRWQRSQQRSQAASIATGLHRGSLWQILTAFG